MVVPDPGGEGLRQEFFADHGEALLWLDVGDERLRRRDALAVHELDADSFVATQQDSFHRAVGARRRPPPARF